MLQTGKNVLVLCKCHQKLLVLKQLLHIFFLDVVILGSSTFSTSNVPTHSEPMVTLPRVHASLGRQSLLTNEKEFEPEAGPSGYRGDRLYLTQHKLT